MEPKDVGFCPRGPPRRGRVKPPVARLLETTCPLVGADFTTSLRAAHAAYELPRLVLMVRFGGRKPQHGGVARLHFHPACVAACMEDAMNRRQIVAGHIE